MTVGVNCTPPAFISDLLASAGGVTVVYPNSGETWDAERRSWMGESSERPRRIAELAPKWRRLGARVVGGCCRTTPATISAIRAALQESTL
jgi:homocysteine S-methyltransferase